MHDQQVEDRFQKLFLDEVNVQSQEVGEELETFLVEFIFVEIQRGGKDHLEDGLCELWGEALLDELA